MRGIAGETSFAFEGLFEPADHLVESRRQPADLVARSRLFDALAEIAAANALGCARQPINRAQGSAGKPQPPQARKQKRHGIGDGEKKQQLLLRALNVSEGLPHDNEEHLAIFIARGPGNYAHVLGRGE